MAEEQEQMRIAINRKITQIYPKLVADSKRISGYNYGQYGEDLLAFCLAEFLTKKDLAYQYKVTITDNKLPNYLGRSMSLQIKSSSSGFWHQYRKEAYNSRGIYNVEFDDVKYRPLEPVVDVPEERFDTPQFHNPSDCVEWAVSKLDYYDKKLIEEYYYNKLTFYQIHKKYNITLNSVKHDIRKAVKQLKQYCNNI